MTKELTFIISTTLGALGDCQVGIFQLCLLLHLPGIYK